MEKKQKIHIENNN